MTDDQIRERINQMIDADARGDVDFTQRLEIISQETAACDCGWCPPSTRVVVALDLIQDPELENEPSNDAYIYRAT